MWETSNKISYKLQVDDMYPYLISNQLYLSNGRHCPARADNPPIALSPSSSQIITLVIICDASLSGRNVM